MSRPTRPQRRLRRRDAMRFLAHPRRLRGSLRLSPQPWLRNSALVALQMAFIVAIALPLVLISPWPGMVGYASLGALVGLFGRFAERGRRVWVLLMAGLIQCGGILVMSLVSWSGAPMVAQLAALALLAGLLHVLSVRLRLGPPGGIILTFAAAAALSPPADLWAITERLAAAGAVALFALVLCTATEAWRLVRPVAEGYPGDHPPPGYDLRAATLRIIIAAYLAALICLGLGANYPVWASLGAMAVLQGAQLHVSTSRAFQRVFGTIFGAGIAWVVLTIDPHIGFYVLMLVLLQFGTELVIGSNYALAQVFVTPMALLMTHLAAPDRSSAEIAPERVMDTIVGAFVGLAVGLVFSTLEDRKMLARQHRRGL
ncbi:FUSC family protein [Xinfangfangia sp. CPCC 101601]|uniref:FUSC family protein n=1 Tax=Pseudogemmobacter lacusdianii TaxID=3069608 RepID=A0ABU0VXV9_9RHOB|nr:FUSC family protein [Xinfangfangia sp. CPCC 101601]MDQ2066458.1 FUSC family protein [Xinfangfangia sp. CPCC 101601]